MTLYECLLVVGFICLFVCILLCLYSRLCGFLSVCRYSCLLHSDSVFCFIVVVVGDVVVDFHVDFAEPYQQMSLASF